MVEGALLPSPTLPCAIQNCAPSLNSHDWANSAGHEEVIAVFRIVPSQIQVAEQVFLCTSMPMSIFSMYEILSLAISLASFGVSSYCPPNDFIFLASFFLRRRNSYIVV